MIDRLEWVQDLKLVLVGSISGLLSGLFVYMFIVFAKEINAKAAIFVSIYLALSWGVILSLIILVLMKSMTKKEHAEYENSKN
jgi:hypothetical protein